MIRHAKTEFSQAIILQSIVISRRKNCLREQLPFVQWILFFYKLEGGVHSWRYHQRCFDFVGSCPTFHLVEQFSSPIMIREKCLSKLAHCVYLLILQLFFIYFLQFLHKPENKARRIHIFN